MSVTVLDPRTDALTDVPLPDLAAQANEAHMAATDAAQAAIEHAARAGRVLMEVKARLDRGAWVPWLEANFHATPQTARVYMRIAAHTGMLLTSGSRTISEADHFLAAHAAAQLPQRQQRAKALISDGRSQKEVAEILGADPKTVRKWLTEKPTTVQDRRKRNRRAARSRAALRRQERDAAMRKAPGGIPEVYSRLRKLAQFLDTAAGEVQGQAREHLERAQDRLAQAEDHVVAASKGAPSR